MEDFLSNPNEITAQIMLEKEPLEELVKKCANENQAADILVLLFQLNRFNIVEAIGVEKLSDLLDVKYLQAPILENLRGIELPDRDYSQLISALFKIFVSENIGAYKLAHSVLVSKFGPLLVTETYMNQYSTLLSNEDSVIKVRALELVIELANLHNFEAFDNHGLISLGLSMITSGDILLQIVAIEVVIDLGNSESGCKKLIDPQVLQVLNSAFEGQPDANFRNRLVLMFARIVHFTGNFTVIKENYWRTLQKMIEGTDVSAIKASLNSLGYLSSRPPGLTTILSKPDLLSELKSIQRSPNQSTKSHFYHFLSEFLPLLNEDQLILLNSHVQPVQPMINELLNPFQELHSDILKAFIVLIGYESHALSILSQNKFKEYLFKRPPHQVHQVSCLKFEIVERLNKHTLPQALKTSCEKYLKAGVFAGPSDEDVELDVMS